MRDTARERDDFIPFLVFPEFDKKKSEKQTKKADCFEKFLNCLYKYPLLAVHCFFIQSLERTQIIILLVPNFSVPTALFPVLCLVLHLNSQLTIPSSLLESILQSMGLHWLTLLAPASPCASFWHPALPGSSKPPPAQGEVSRWYQIAASSFCFCIWFEYKGMYTAGEFINTVLQKYLVNGC